MFQLLFTAAVRAEWERAAVSPGHTYRVAAVHGHVFDHPVSLVQMSTAIASIRLFTPFPDPLVQMYLPGQAKSFVTCRFEVAKQLDQSYDEIAEMLEDLGMNTPEIVSAELLRKHSLEDAYSSPLI